MRILHTADWQLGLKLQFIPGDRGAFARAARFEVVRAIAERARTEAADVVLVAGDVFDDNAVTPDTLQRAADALAAFAPIPVLLLPGNHDAATAESALGRLPAMPHLRILLDATPVELPGLRVLPCPLRRRHEREDPTAVVPPRKPGDPIRVVLAHGGVLDFAGDEAEPPPNRIDLDRLLAQQVDYVALGDWHGTLQLRPRAWYPGAPEATRFKEKAPGNVLLVDIAGPGATPVVQVVPVARTRWIQRTVELVDAEIDELAAWFAALPERSHSLVELRLGGTVSLAGRARLDALIEAEAEALLHLRVASDEVVLHPGEDDLAELGGWLGEAAARLRADPADADALLLLHRLAT